ncbi:MAG: S26 family signal peptidase, partial [Propionibacteriaceae bacterium]|nr:S26 family signal peptidase [Propionibacteriaceae bacterium]
MVSALVAASSAKPRRAIEEPKPRFRRKARAADEEPRPRSRRKARAADAEPVDPGGYPEPADPLGPDDQAGEEGSAPPPDPPSLGVKIFRLAREAVVILVIALIISTLIRTFGVEQFRVPTGSMEQTLYGE